MRSVWAASAFFYVCASPLAMPAAAAIQGAQVVQVAPGNFVRLGACEEATPQNKNGIANIGFIVGDQAVAVIDPGGSLADGAGLRAAIRAATKLPIRYVIMTHAHPDHVFGGGAFAADHPIYVGHWALPAALANRAAYDHARLAAILGESATGNPVSPTRVVHDRLSLDLGDRILELQAFPAAHTGTDLTVLDRKSATLWAGDLLFAGRVPSLDGSLTGWLHALDQLQRAAATRVIPGHGPASLPWPEGAKDERRYLMVLLHDVRAAITAGRDVASTTETAGQGERNAWHMFDAYNGHNVTVAYKELQWE